MVNNFEDFQGHKFEDPGFARDADKWDPEAMNRLRPFGFVNHKIGTNLTLEVAPSKWLSSGALLSFPGGEIDVPTSQVSYLYLDGAEGDATADQLKIATGAFPAGPGVKWLAIVTSGSTSIPDGGVVNVLRNPSPAAYPMWNAAVVVPSATADSVDVGPVSTLYDGVVKTYAGGTIVAPAGDSFLYLSTPGMSLFCAASIAHPQAVLLARVNNSSSVVTVDPINKLYPSPQAVDQAFGLFTLSATLDDQGSYRRHGLATVKAYGQKSDNTVAAVRNSSNAIVIERAGLYKCTLSVKAGAAASSHDTRLREVGGSDIAIIEQGTTTDLQLTAVGYVSVASGALPFSMEVAVLGQETRYGGDAQNHLFVERVGGV